MLGRTPADVLQALPACITGTQAVQYMNQALASSTIVGNDMRPRQALADAVNGPSSIGLEIPWFAKDPIYCMGSAPYEKVKALIAAVVPPAAGAWAPPTPQQVQAWTPAPAPKADNTWLWVTGAAVVLLSAGLVYFGRRKRLTAIMETTTPLSGPRQRGALDDRLQAFFSRRKAAIAPAAAMTAAFTSAELARAVRSGALRKGVSGYWLREEPDPGAAAIMRRQMREVDYADL